MEPIYRDILIEDDDIALNNELQAIIITDAEVILQDMIHAIRESGLLTLMIADRSADKQQLLKNELELLIEEDIRIIPGSILIEEEATGNRNEKRLLITANTYEFGNIATGMEYPA